MEKYYITENDEITTKEEIIKMLIECQGYTKEEARKNVDSYIEYSIKHGILKVEL